MYVYSNIDLLTEKELNNILDFVEELTGLEEKYRVTISSDYYEDYDYDYDYDYGDNPVPRNIRSDAVILDENDYVICDLTYLRDELIKKRQMENNS